MKAKALDSPLPYQGVCGRHGEADRCVTLGGLVVFGAGTPISTPISASEMGRDARPGVGPSNSTSRVAKAI